MAQAFRQRLTLTHLTRVREIRESVRKGPGALEPSGASTYLGSVKSHAMVRVYDKEAESGRQGAGVRWEVQLRGGYAGAFLEGAAAATDRLGDYVVGTIRGFVDFRHRAKDSRGDRVGLLDWWSLIVGDAERAKLGTPVKQDALVRRAMWLQQQVAPTLALVQRAYGDDFLRDLLASGARRLTPGDLRLIDDWCEGAA